MIHLDKIVKKCQKKRRDWRERVRQSDTFKVCVKESSGEGIPTNTGSCSLARVYAGSAVVQLR